MSYDVLLISIDGHSLVHDAAFSAAEDAIARAPGRHERQIELDGGVTWFCASAGQADGADRAEIRLHAPPEPPAPNALAGCFALRASSGLTDAQGALLFDVLKATDWVAFFAVEGRLLHSVEPNRVPMPEGCVHALLRDGAHAAELMRPGFRSFQETAC